MKACEEAMEYLRDEGNKKPCIILLDSNMPKMNGIEFLKVLKADDVLKKVPIIALTTCKEEQHIEGSFNLGVASYIVKPLDYRKFVGVIRVVDLYWTPSELPNL
jgi:DNA-binding response OmpR family regulator